jgi:hypothetical protein
VKLFPVPKTDLVVELLLRNEHCPPHVHVENEKVPWEARFEFSFVSNAVRLMDIDPIQDAPSIKTIDCIRAAITANLVKCRKEWWERIGDCCINNRWMCLTEDGELAILGKRDKDATQIRAVVYDVGKKELTVSLKDGAVHVKTAGKGVYR